eukprot:Blabericola_migrator_1__1352@NODE_1351_length_4742_cov_13_507166_g669_i2_p8_GENE_NODE_1351_length_4742_cov_13_507166_g669_i2NODE_1351_length_4742_cov_13_507166_g669_i2_p8_ORF_typecomplete_len115_score15_53_NODE_1351_length_4742_cov_13_507166_g669_i219872331
MKTVSLWNERNVQISHEDDVRILPETILRDQAEAAIREFEIDLKGNELQQGNAQSKNLKDRNADTTLEWMTQQWMEATGNSSPLKRARHSVTQEDPNEIRNEPLPPECTPTTIA